MSKAIDGVIAEFKKIYPKLTITLIVNYSVGYFIIEAVEDPSHNTSYDSLYAVNKKNGRITSFTPAENPDAWVDAVEKRTLYRFQ